MRTQAGNAFQRVVRDAARPFKHARSSRARRRGSGKVQGPRAIVLNGKTFSTTFSEKYAASPKGGKKVFGSSSKERASPYSFDYGEVR